MQTRLFRLQGKKFQFRKKRCRKKFNDLITSVMNDGLKNNILIEKNIDLINKKAKILDESTDQQFYYLG